MIAHVEAQPASAQTESATAATRTSRTPGIRTRRMSASFRDSSQSAQSARPTTAPPLGAEEPVAARACAGVRASVRRAAHVRRAPRAGDGVARGASIAYDAATMSAAAGDERGSFRYTNPARIHWGAGSAAEHLDAELERLGAQRAFLVTTR